MGWIGRTFNAIKSMVEDHVGKNRDRGYAAVQSAQVWQPKRFPDFLVPPGLETRGLEAIAASNLEIEETRTASTRIQTRERPKAASYTPEEKVYEEEIFEDRLDLNLNLRDLSRNLKSLKRDIGSTYFRYGENGRRAVEYVVQRLREKVDIIDAAYGKDGMESLDYKNAMAIREQMLGTIRYITDDFFPSTARREHKEIGDHIGRIILDSIRVPGYSNTGEEAA